MGGFQKVCSLIIAVSLLIQQSGFAQVETQNFASLHLSSHLRAFHSTITPDKYRPLHLRYLGYDSQSNDFKLLLDKGDFFSSKSSVVSGKSKDKKDLQLTTYDLQLQLKQLMEYFFIGVSLPNESFWVNLRPDSENNIIDSELAKTDIGRILLEADVQLKKDTALYTSPQTKEGREYWNKLYKKAEELYGYENITIPTLTRPWIVPGEIIIRETGENKGDGNRTVPSAYIYKATLKVMLEDDYLKSYELGAMSYEFKDQRLKELNKYSTQLIKELIIPRITKEVNTSRKYARLRQVYYSLILAQWFKQRFNRRGGSLLCPPDIKSDNHNGTAQRPSPTDNYTHLINSGNLNGLTSTQTWDKQTYYQQYQQSFKDGEYNLKEPVRTPFGQTIRSYFSGGIRFGSEMVKAVSSGIMQGKNDLNFEQIFRQSPENLLAINNYIIPAVFESGNIKISSAVVKEISLPTDATINNKRNFMTKKTLPIFLSAVIALNSFLFSCTQIKLRQITPAYKTQEYSVVNMTNEEKLIKRIESMELNNAEARNLSLALRNAKLSREIVDVLALKLQKIYGDGIQGENEEILLDMILYNYKREGSDKTETQIIIDNALKKISYEILFNLKEVLQLSRDEVEIIKRKIDRKLEYLPCKTNKVAANANFKIYNYICLGTGWLDGLRDCLAHEIGHNILRNKEIYPFYWTEKNRVCHELFAYLSGNTQIGWLSGCGRDSMSKEVVHVQASYQLDVMGKFIGGGSAWNDLQRYTLRQTWKRLAKVALDEICKGKSFKEVVQAMFKEAGYNGDLKAVRIKGLERDIYVPVDFEIELGEYFSNENSRTSKGVSSSMESNTAVIDNTYDRILQIILNSPQVTEASRERQKALAKIGQEVERYIQQLFNNNKIKIAVVPLGSTLKGYANPQSDIEYTILILDGIAPGIYRLEQDKKDDILNCVKTSLADEGFKVDEFLQMTIEMNNIVGIIKSLTERNDSVCAYDLFYLFLPAVYGDDGLLEYRRKEAVYAIAGQTNPQAAWGIIQEQFLEVLSIRWASDVLNNTYLQAWLEQQGVDTDSIISQLRQEGITGSWENAEEGKELEISFPAIEEFNKKRVREIGLSDILHMAGFYGRKDKQVNFQVSASPVTTEKRNEALGGINFGVMPIVTQQMINPANNFRGVSSGIASPRRNIGVRNDTNRLGNDNIAGWLQIEKLVSSGIMPSPERVRERLVDSYYDDAIDEELSRAVCCIAAIMRLEEGDPVMKSKWKALLRLLESDIPSSQLQIELKQLVFLPK